MATPLYFGSTVAAVGGEVVTRELIEELLSGIVIPPPEGAATEETLSEINDKVIVSQNVGGVLSAYSGADNSNIVRGYVSSADLTTFETLIPAESNAYFQLEELHLTVLSDVTVTLRVGGETLWQFTGPGQEHFVSLHGLAPSTAGNEAVIIEADDPGDVTAYVAVRRILLPSA